MLSLTGSPVRVCDGLTRREILRVGGLSLFGLSLPQFLQLRAMGQTAPAGAASTFGRAKSVILLFLQGGPSHLDIWDPKPDAPDNVRGLFSPIQTRAPGIMLSEVMPMLAEQADKFTLIRSLGCEPKGLFNHTAAMYMFLTGHDPTEFSPSGQLEQPGPEDHPAMGAVVSMFRPPDTPMLPFVVMPRPTQESNVIGKAQTAGFLGGAYNPFTMYEDPTQPELNVSGLTTPVEVPVPRLEERMELRRIIDSSLHRLDQTFGTESFDRYYEQAFSLVVSGNAQRAFAIQEEPTEVRERYGMTRFGQSCLLARRLVEAGTRFVQVNWNAVANGNPQMDAWDTHAANFDPLRNLHCPILDRSLSALLEDLDQRGMLDETLVIAQGEFGRSPKLGVSTSGNSNAPDGRDHWPYCYTALIAGAGVRRGALYGASDAQGARAADSPCHPWDILATMYHSIGIDPQTTIYDDLQRPHHLVYRGEPLLGLFG